MNLARPVNDNLITDADADIIWMKPFVNLVSVEISSSRIVVALRSKA
jgi:hypothetical protein